MRWISVSARPIARPREADRGAPVRRAEDDDQEHERHDDLGDQGGGQRVAAGRMLAVAVGREAAGEVESRLAAGDEIQHAGAGDGSGDLGDHVPEDVAPPESPAGPEPDGDRGVEVTARDRPERVGARQDGQAEGERHADEPDAQGRKRRGQHRAAASAENEPERSEELAGELGEHGLLLPVRSGESIPIRRLPVASRRPDVRLALTKSRFIWAMNSMADLLRAGGLALAVVRAVAEALGVHLRDHAERRGRRARAGPAAGGRGARPSPRRRASPRRSGRPRRRRRSRCRRPRPSRDPASSFGTGMALRVRRAAGRRR